MKKRLRIIEDFIKKESASGIILMFVTVIAMLIANSPIDWLYHGFFKLPMGFNIANFEIQKPLILWVNDGLMAIFFFLIGLEVKREIVEGHLSTPSQVTLPIFSAIGGIVAPALVFVYFNYHSPLFMRGWAIPAATDIAFALGVLSLLGSRVPASLKIFLMALAIIDDLAAIVIIALFYTSKLSTSYIAIAFVCLSILLIMNRMKVSRKMAYVLMGLVMWACTLKSGVHATLAGVTLGFIIPLTAKDSHGKEFSPAKQMEKDLHYWVAFLVLPVFAFANAGISLKGMSINELFTPLPLGIMLGLFIGKQLGVFLFSYAVIALKWTKLPKGSNYLSLYGVSVLTGIGFTMSLFIESLAFQNMTVNQDMSKLAILLGSLFSALFGVGLLMQSKAPGQKPSLKGD